MLEMALLELAEKLLFTIANGVVWALITALVALGLSFIFGLMGIVNVAHGELYTLGAVLTWYSLTRLGSFWLGIALAPLAVGALGSVLERFAIRPVEGRPAYTVIVTVGIAFVIQQAVLATFGGWPQVMPDPMPIVVHFAGVRYPAYRIFVAAVSVLALMGLWSFLHKTSLGLSIRAAMQDRDMASAMGIPVSSIYVITFSLGAALAALGGALAAPIVQLHYLMGLDILCLAFIVVIIGGLGSLKGTFVTSLIICPLENVLSLFITPTEARVVSFVVMATVLLLRPRGLFGTIVR